MLGICSLMYHDYTISFGFLLPTSVFFFFFGCSILKTIPHISRLRFPQLRHRFQARYHTSNTMAIDIITVVVLYDHFHTSYTYHLTSRGVLIQIWNSAYTIAARSNASHYRISWPSISINCNSNNQSSDLHIRRVSVNKDMTL